jgi:hypothetical protein
MHDWFVITLFFPYKVKDKFLPVPKHQATEPYRRHVGKIPYNNLALDEDEWLVSCSDSFTFQRKNPWYPLDWVRSQVGLVMKAKRKIPTITKNQILVIQPIASNFTVWTILAFICTYYVIIRYIWDHWNFLWIFRTTDRILPDNWIGWQLKALSNCAMYKGLVLVDPWDYENQILLQDQ